jgi:hypothetical protein
MLWARFMHGVRGAYGAGGQAAGRASMARPLLGRQKAASSDVLRHRASVLRVSEREGGGGPKIALSCSFVAPRLLLSGGLQHQKRGCQ